MSSQASAISLRTNKKSNVMADTPPANDNDKQYPALDEHGEVYDWFLAGIGD